MLDRPIDFVIAGTQKGGTTALAKLLPQHPEVCTSAKKELHFFDEDRFFTEGDADTDWYHAQFAPAPGARIFGEATPVYMYWEPAAERMWRYNPALKLILILRNPVDRAWSHWRMTTRRGEETLDFSTAIRTEAERCRESRQHRIYSYIDRGRYAGQIARLRRYFPENRMLIFRNEELRRDAQAVMDRMCAFVGLSTVPVRLRPIREVRDGVMSAEDRAFLHEQFDPEIDALESLLGWDCRAWRNPVCIRNGSHEA